MTREAVHRTGIRPANDVRREPSLRECERWEKPGIPRRAIAHSRYPVLRADELLGMAPPLFLLGFAAAYYVTTAGQRRLAANAPPFRAR